VSVNVIGESPVDVTAQVRRGAGSAIWQAFTGNRKAMVGGIMLAIFVAMALFAPVLAPGDPAAGSSAKLEGPSLGHLLGTTFRGEDILAQVIWGARQSLVIAVIAGGVATAVSVLVGVTSAYLGGLSDHVLSLVTDVFLVIPALPLMIIIAAYARSSSVAILILVIVLTGWSFGARQMRSQGLSLRNREFLEAARVRGERIPYVIVFEMLPTMTSLIVANFLGAALYAVLAAAGLQFIGLGDINQVSWGSMLYWSQNNEALMSGAPLWAIAPGLCIGLLGAAFALLNYAFDELGNPALRPIRTRRGRRRIT
jgi:peptide/nickel transport system permease protein